MEFTIIESRATTLNRAFNRAVINEKSLSPLFPLGEGWGAGGAVVTNDWCIINQSIFNSIQFRNIYIKKKQKKTENLLWFRQKISCCKK